MHRRRCRVAALATGLLIATGCGSPSADDIARALEADGAEGSVARCVGDQAIASDLSSDSLARLAEEGITDDNGEDVQFLEDDTAILQALVTACLSS
ncbi:MAG: hypothetical protein M3313_07870 [Actinomycetota bacterium]|nr:hypothetical protein [Actinomycetota bacterium]